MTIKLKGSTDGSISLQAPADTSPTGTDITLTLPTDAGSADQFLKNSGTAGTLDYSSMVEDSSGRVGIGTTSPDRLLELAGSGGATSVELRLNATDGGERQITLTGAGSNTHTIKSTGTTDNSLAFVQGSDERCRITSAGEFLVGKSNGATVNNGLTITSGGRLYDTIPNGNTYHVYDSTNSLYRFYVKSNGGIVNYSANNSNLSDERLKKNIESLDSTWECLKHWELKKFHYSQDSDTDDKKYGVIAQQVAPHCPEVIDDFIVQPAEDAILDEDGNVVAPATEEVVRMGVKEGQMMWMAIKALQEAIAKIETLETKVAALEGN